MKSQEIVANYILDLLVNHESISKTDREIATKCGVSKSTVSKVVRLVKEKHLIKVYSWCKPAYLYTGHTGGFIWFRAIMRGEEFPTERVAIIDT